MGQNQAWRYIWSNSPNGGTALGGGRSCYLRLQACYKFTAESAEERMLAIGVRGTWAMPPEFELVPG